MCRCKTVYYHCNCIVGLVESLMVIMVVSMEYCLRLFFAIENISYCEKYIETLSKSPTNFAAACVVSSAVVIE